MKTIAITVLAAAGLMLLPAAALATDASGGAGADYGQHHATMAQAGELDAAMNPGMHDGFSGWMMHAE